MKTSNKITARIDRRDCFKKTKVREHTLQFPVNFSKVRCKSEEKVV